MAPNRAQRGSQNFTDSQRLFMLESDLDDNDIAIINRFKLWEDQWNRFELRLMKRDEEVDKSLKEVNAKFDESRKLSFGVLTGVSISAILLAANIILEVSK